MFLVLNEIKKNYKRFFLIVLIIFLISYLVFFLTGLAYGLANANRSAIDLWDAEGIILKKGSNYSLMSSMLDYSDIDNFNDINVSPINISRSVSYRNSKKDEENTFNIVFLGIDYKSKINPEIIEGTFPSSLNEVVASIDLKNDDGFVLGDTLEDSRTGRKMDIVGFVPSAKFSVSPVVYTELFLVSPGLRNTRPESASEDAISTSTKMAYDKIPEMPLRIAGIIVHSNFDENIFISNDLGDDYEYLDIDKFIEKLPGYKAQFLTFSMMIGFLVVISAVVIGVFIYILNMQKKHIFAVMKIQGISDYYIGKTVFIETFFLSLIAVALGFFLVYITGISLPAKVPFEFKLDYSIAAAFLMIISSLLSSLFSVRTVMKIDALDALR